MNPYKGPLWYIPMSGISSWSILFLSFRVIISGVCILASISSRYHLQTSYLNYVAVKKPNSHTLSVAGCVVSFCWISLSSQVGSLLWACSSCSQKIFLSAFFHQLQPKKEEGGELYVGGQIVHWTVSFCWKDFVHNTVKWRQMSHSIGEHIVRHRCYCTSCALVSHV